MEKTLTISCLNGEPQIFKTLQGEGPSLGEPAVFLRLSGCNLQCHWCDTPFTWNFEKTPFQHREAKKYLKSNVQKKMGISEVVEKITAFKPQRLVMTGGEPLLQMASLEIFIEEILKKTSLPFIEIETNGTVAPSKKLISMVTQWNVSPKLSQSKMSQDKSLKNKVLKIFSNSNKAYFKFVLCSEQELSEISFLVQELKIDPRRVYLMPEGTTSEELDKKESWIKPLIITSQYQFSDRLHIRQNIP